MPVVDTTITFSNNEQITSTKLNDIMDNSSFVNGAVVTSGGLEVTAGGQMQIASNGVTAAKIAAASVTQAKIGTNVASTGPAFHATSATATTVPTNTDTRMVLDTETFDTNSNYAGSRFQPNIAGYYHISGNINPGAALNTLTAVLYKTGVRLYVGPNNTTGSRLASVSALMYLNGSSDWVELYAFHATGSTNSMTGDMYGYLVRAA